MAVVRMFKMPFATRVFRQNQHVWVRFLSGDEAAECVGRYRGRGRYVTAWVNWRAAEKPAPNLQAIEVDDIFAARHDLSQVEVGRLTPRRED